VGLKVKKYEGRERVVRQGVASRKRGRRNRIEVAVGRDSEGALV